MVSAAQAREKYDQLVDRYEEIFFYVGTVGQRLVEFAAPAPGSRVLDVGAGRGAVTRAALGLGCSVTAVDASPKMIARLVEDHPEVTGVAMDAAHLDFADGAFDLAAAGFVVQVLDDPAAVLGEVHRVLRPGGIVALSLETQSVGRLGWFQDLTLEFFAPSTEAGPPPPADDSTEQTGPLTHDRLDALLADTGFADVERLSIEMPVPIADPPALWDWLLPRGLAEIHGTLPEDRRAEFHTRFLAGAQTMHDDGGITLDFAATLHRARRP
ncbi:class I SAM-dependent methyltransferase [Amycolatopsis magusensis]|uniref:class I SAM-dependent methyltransferase n=1 Tax=Amycolatopsis magusensis TaxID=882444 RepID=UPI0024A82F09|nr:class I SAM-dependent methyltransferase [Amycolatopsis magusensis]MDI5982253.1 methyltransferase domain-containing protein [Amycolatopsis magusensis]